MLSFSDIIHAQRSGNKLYFCPSIKFPLNQTRYEFRVCVSLWKYFVCVIRCTEEISISILAYAIRCVIPSPEIYIEYDKSKHRSLVTSSGCSARLGSACRAVTPKIAFFWRFTQNTLMYNVRIRLVP